MFCNRQDIFKNGLRFSSKVSCVFCEILFKVQFVLQIFVKISNIKFYKQSFNLSRGISCGQTDRERERDRHVDRNGEDFSSFS